MPFDINAKFTPSELAAFWSLGSWRTCKKTGERVFKPAADTIYRMHDRGEIKGRITETGRILFSWSDIWFAMGVVSVRGALPHQHNWLEFAEKPLTLKEAALELRVTPKGLAMRLGERKAYRRVRGRLPFFRAGARQIRILPIAIRESCFER